MYVCSSFNRLLLEVDPRTLTQGGRYRQSFRYQAHGEKRAQVLKSALKKQLKVGVIGAGQSGLVTAMELSDTGHSVEVFDSRSFLGGKVGSWMDKEGNHIEWVCMCSFSTYSLS